MRIPAASDLEGKRDCLLAPELFRAFIRRQLTGSRRHHGMHYVLPSAVALHGRRCNRMKGAVLALRSAVDGAFELRHSGDPMQCCRSHEENARLSPFVRAVEEEGTFAGREAEPHARDLPRVGMCVWPMLAWSKACSSPPLLLHAHPSHPSRTQEVCAHGRIVADCQCPLAVSASVRCPLLTTVSFRCQGTPLLKDKTLRYLRNLSLIHI